MSSPFAAEPKPAESLSDLVKSGVPTVHRTRCGLRAFRFQQQEVVAEIARRAAELLSSQCGMAVECWAMNFCNRTEGHWSSIAVQVNRDSRASHVGMGELLFDTNDNPCAAECSTDCSFKNTQGQPVIVPLAHPAYRFRTALGSEYRVFADGTCSRRRHDLFGRYPLSAQVFFVTPETVARMREARATSLILRGTFPAAREPAVGMHPLEYGRLHAEGDPGQPATWTDGEVTFPHVSACWHHTGDLVTSIDRD